jgi:hypothetical protein
MAGNEATQLSRQEAHYQMPYTSTNEALDDLQRAKPIPFPVPMDDVFDRCLVCTLSRQEVAEVLGPPTLTDWIYGLGIHDFWAYEYPCGLKLAYQIAHSRPGGCIVLDSPEIEHAARHIPFRRADLEFLDDDALNWVTQTIIQHHPERSVEIANLKAFQVWRIDDNGNVFTVGEPTSERDARCLVAHYEARGHKQMYWVAPAK